MKPARFLLPGASALAMATGPAPVHAEVRIGLAAPLTGRYAWGGAETEQGAEAAVADLNASGGVLGEKVEMITALRGVGLENAPWRPPSDTLSGTTSPTRPASGGRSAILRDRMRLRAAEREADFPVAPVP